MTESTPNSGNAVDLAALRDKAKGLGIPNYQVKGYVRLYKEVMESIDAIAEGEKEKTHEAKVKSDASNIKANQETSDTVAKQEELHPFTDPKTKRIGLYVLTDSKNMVPHNDKKTAYRFVRWAS